MPVYGLTSALCCWFALHGDNAAHNRRPEIQREGAKNAKEEEQKITNFDCSAFLRIFRACALKYFFILPLTP